MEQSIFKFEGEKPGKTVAVFAGVHGNERAGILALEGMIPGIKIESGVLYLVFANVAGIEQNARQLSANLNRCFSRDIKITLPEHERANELMDLLDSCDALLDLHSSNSIETTPFIICEENGLSFAQYFDFPIVSTGWGAVHPGGTDDYMNSSGKIGICLECGSTKFPEKNVAQAKQAINIFLRLFGMQSGEIVSYAENQVRINATERIMKETSSFSYSKEYGDFEELPEGEVFATDGDIRHVAQKDQVILFPRPDNRVGSEVGVLGTQIEKHL